jgi:hypothetical protein
LRKLRLLPEWLSWVQAVQKPTTSVSSGFHGL